MDSNLQRRTLQSVEGSLGKVECNCGANAPSLWTVFRRFCPVTRAELKADGLFVECDELRYRDVDRNAPLVAFPIVGANPCFSNFERAIVCLTL